MNRLVRASPFFALLVLCVSSVPTDKHGPKVPRDLSDETHYNKDAHNADYDHEAFLGEEVAQTFDQLSPAEAKRRLGVIVDKIDKNGDGSVTEPELVVWIRHVAKRYVYDDVDRHFPYHDKDENGKISWEEYKTSAYGMVQDLNEIHDHHRNLTYNQAIDRDQKKFSRADRNADQVLDKEEYCDFLHPHEAPHMRDIVIEETMTDMDKNKDGFVELEEYVNDLWPAYEREGKEEEPDWLAAEREQFHKHRDKDANGKLDKEELGEWVLPKDFDHAEAEAKHLVYQADVNKDEVLSKAEIMDQQDLFVGSQATDFGDYFVRHDEF